MARQQSTSSSGSVEYSQSEWGCQTIYNVAYLINLNEIQNMMFMVLYYSLQRLLFTQAAVGTHEQ